LQQVGDALPLVAGQALLVGEGLGDCPRAHAALAHGGGEVVDAGAGQALVQEVREDRLAALPAAGGRGGGHVGGGGRGAGAGETDVRIVLVEGAAVAKRRLHLLGVERDIHAMLDPVLVDSAATDVRDAVEAHAADALLHGLRALGHRHVLVAQRIFSRPVPALVRVPTFVVALGVREGFAPHLRIRLRLHVQGVLDAQVDRVNRGSVAAALACVLRRDSRLRREVAAGAHQPVVRGVGIEHRESVSAFVFVRAMEHQQRSAFTVDDFAVAEPVPEQLLPVLARVDEAARAVLDGAHLAADFDLAAS
jgi:hypothetical protein